MKEYAISLTILFFAAIPFTANSQKLPEIQKKSMKAPAGVRVDGKRSEWDNLIQASNKVTGISYTISNDNNKLYLVILAEDIDIANKIINAGVTFTINGSGRRHDENGMAVTFPFLYQKDYREYRPLLEYDKEVSVWNKQLTAKIKDINVTGIKGIKDTISIYNPEGIKSAVLFGEDRVFTYELAIPLKYLELSAKDPKPFAYSIKLNGVPNYEVPLNYTLQVLGSDGKHTTLPPPTKDAFNRNNAFQHIRSHLLKLDPNSAEVISLITPSYLSGEYTLVK